MKKTVLQLIEKAVRHNGDKTAIVTATEKMTYREMWRQSDALARWLRSQAGQGEKPVMVYGHKSPGMIVCFLGCAKAGIPYCPVDASMPAERAEEIASAIGNDIILGVSEIAIEGYDVIGPERLRRITEDPKLQSAVWDDAYPTDDRQVFYIIFTSGSTGKPKGVEVTAGNLKNFVEWSAALTEEKGGKKLNFLNQAPFSFDLSVMDTYTCLATGGKLACLDMTLLADMKKMFDFMKDEQVQCWVSTPSFAEMCMADPVFTGENFPHMRLFLFCGERLTVETAAKLRQKFPDARIVNTYGPTESTVAVTSQEITDEIINGSDLLPIGKPKKGTELLIRDGEIYITGDTVAKGYFNDIQKTNEAFVYTEDARGKKVRAYKTGDKGFFRHGRYYCTGRSDHQIKMRGYRIELGDIEENLVALEEVEQAAVLPRRDGEKIKSLTAFVNAPELSGTLADAKLIKFLLKEKLPHYMIPRNIKFVDKLPMTANGKLDRKKLEEQFL